MKKSDKLRLRLRLVEQRGFTCEACGRALSSFHLHHGIINDKKSLRDVLFCEENLFIVGPVCCHLNRSLDNQAQRVKFWLLQVERYGLPRMLAWLDRVNEGLIVPYRFPD